MKRLIFFIILFVASFSCKNSSTPFKTYLEAEEEFCNDLTSEDTLSVLSLTGDFLDFIKSNKVDSALALVHVLDQSVLYKSSNLYKEELKDRFDTFPVLKYELLRFSFSTAGNNDVCYKYSFTGDSNYTTKLVFNPVKIDGKWFLTLKDGSQSSMDKLEDNRIHPHSPAPDTIVLNTSSE